MEQAKAKVTALIDTPGRPFIGLKEMHRQHAASIIRQQMMISNGKYWLPFSRMKKLLAH
jgi:hypothetical protein